MNKESDELIIPPFTDLIKMLCKCGQPMGIDGHADVYERDGVTYVSEVRCAKCEEMLGKP
jgi:hypothetical protein